MFAHKYLQLGVIILVAIAMMTACASPVVETLTSSSTQAPNPGPTATLAAISTSAGTSIQPGAGGTASANTLGSSQDASGLKFEIDPSNSSASYSVREQLARLNLPSDAVGKTSAISGSIVINSDGSIDSANSKFTVDVSTLQTDSAMRDNFVARNILQSNQYPQATFIPTKAVGLPSTIPQSGNVIFQLTGNLTIRDVTKPVTWNVTGSIANGVATGTATTSFKFEDFNLQQPSVPVVLSVVDKITLTVTIGLKPAGN